jgi:hypothetical protein
MNKKLIVPALVVAMGSAAVLGTSQIQAQTKTNNDYPPIVQKLVTKFGLNENEVKAVFDEERAAREAEMKAKMEDRLNQAVANGKITEAQKQKIIAKLQELHEQRAEQMAKFKDMTPEERRAEHQKMKAELEALAKENGIDPQYLMVVKMFKGPGRGGMMKIIN